MSTGGSEYYSTLYKEGVKNLLKQLSDKQNKGTISQLILHFAIKIDHNTGRIRATKNELASEMNISEDDLQEAITWLTENNVLYATPDGFDYFDQLTLNPSIAWAGKIAARKARKRDAPALSSQ